jgi:NAD(P)H-hydrate epimerase
MFEPERIQKLAELLEQTSAAHREAFAESDGADPEWPAWFAGQIAEGFNELLGSELSESQIASLLSEAEQEHLMTAPGREWPGYYAEFFIARAM